MACRPSALISVSNSESEASFRLVSTSRISGRGVDRRFLLLSDDNELVADGSDTTRVGLRVSDEFGAVQPFANDSIRLELDGPAEIIGDIPFSLIGGTGAVWIRALEQPGMVRLKAIHPSLGVQQIEVGVKATPNEMV
jgi:beta-galactosidase